MESRENRTPAQDGRFDWLGGGGGYRKQQRGCRHLWGRVNSPFPPETENSHWLKGDKSVIILSMADQDCAQVRVLRLADTYRDS